MPETGITIALSARAIVSVHIQYPQGENAMSRFVLTSVVALVIAFGFAARVALAEQVKCEGTITKIEGEKVTVKDAGNQEKSMEVVPSTKIMLDGKPGKPADLKVGQHASCTCDKQGDKMTCNTVDARSK
jgi:hypothetical protein